MDLGRHGRIPKPKAIRKRNAIVGALIILGCATHIYFTMLSPMLDPKPYQQFRKKYSQFIPDDKRVD